jgi:hypothetical protein
MARLKSVMINLAEGAVEALAGERLRAEAARVPAQPPPAKKHAMKTALFGFSAATKSAAASALQPSL